MKVRVIEGDITKLPPGTIVSIDNKPYIVVINKTADSILGKFETGDGKESPLVRIRPY